MTKLKLILFTTSFFCSLSIIGQEQILSLEECCTLALQHNKKIQISQTEAIIARCEQEASFTNYLPRINVTGTYLHNSERISLLKKEQKRLLQNIGTELGNNISPLLNEFPYLKEIITSTTANDIANSLNTLGSSIAESFTPDTRNVYGAIISLTQPLYMGGRITAYNKITQLAEKIAQNNIETTRQETILTVNEVYWLIVSLANKKRLAENYLELTNKLHNNVEQMQAEGVATHSELLSTTVKKNEAEIALQQATDALELTRMLLCKLCGIELNSKIAIIDEENKSIDYNRYIHPIHNHTIKRPELYTLQFATDIYNEEKKITKADYLPQLIFTANIITAYPDFTNGFEEKFCSTWNVGLSIRVPLWNWGEGHKKAKAAKAKVDIAHYKLEDIKESIELEVEQAQLQITTTAKRLTLTNSNIKKAEENLHMAEQAFLEGMSTSDKLMEAQTSWLQAHNENIDAKIEIIMSHIRLRRALGILK